MYLQRIHIKNFRLLKDVDIALDKDITLIVGKNNTGKTSIAHILQSVISGIPKFQFDDYPIECREELYEVIRQYWNGSLDVDGIKECIPETTITFYIDYSEEDNNCSLGVLRNFIIDMDDTLTIAQIEAKYAFNSSKTEDILNKCKERYDQLLEIKNDENVTKKDSNSYDYDTAIITAIVKELFNDMFTLAIFAVNPSDDNDRLMVEPKMLRDLFLCKIIKAERSLDESENKNQHPLADIMTRVFNDDTTISADELASAIKELNDYIKGVNFKAQQHITSLMDGIIKRMVKFGYPSSEDLSLKANINISLKEQIENKTDLTYVNDTASESLPSTHNGLGYKNLIKISLILYEFMRFVAKQEACIPLLFIEEPEAHMHPQLQRSFVKFLNQFIEDNLNKKRTHQVIITTHSPHVANTVAFRQVRYLLRRKKSVICKDLQSFYQKAQSNNVKKENLNFLQKYMKLSYCDLYFCDKAILVEGAAERLLLPRMIEKCEEEGVFRPQSPTLASQYYTIIEVGGAYAHRFYDFVDFLEIPTLILTDIDFINSDNEACQLKDINGRNAIDSSNYVIKSWYSDIYGKELQDIKINDILQLAKDNEKKTQGKRHIEFQMEENNAHPRSLEESIQNINRSLYGIDDDAKEIKPFKGNKTDFAITLLTNGDYKDFLIPSYIKEGLKWLNEQNKMSS